jgi:ribonuclease D
MGKDILDALDRADEMDPITEMPPKPMKDGEVHLDEAGSELHERIKMWRRKEATRVGYDSSLVLHRITMGRIALAKPTDSEGVAKIEGIQAWQAETHGEALAATVRDFEADLSSGRWKPGRRRRR